MQSLDLNDGLEIIRKSIQETETGLRSAQDRHYRLLHGRHIRPTVSCDMPELSAAAPFYGDIPEENVLKK